MVMKLGEQSDVDVPSIAAGVFKAKCLGLMDKALADQRPFAITKRGKVVGRFVPEPPEEKPFVSVVGRSPGVRLPTEKQWKAHKEEMRQLWDVSLEKTVRTLQTEKTKKRNR